MHSQERAKGILYNLFSLFYHLVAKNRLIALHNLQRSFPEKDDKGNIRIAKGVYRHFAIVATEFFDHALYYQREYSSMG